MIAVGVRSRRAVANTTLGGLLVTAGGYALCAWALAPKTTPYEVAYDWLNLSLAYSGPSQFQTFIAQVGIHLSHPTLLLVGGCLAIGVAVAVWSRAGARGEPAPARYYGLMTLLVFAAIGASVSTDLAELYTFWGLAGVSTYLLLTHLFADERSTRAARLALAVPAVADLALLAGIAILWSRYGVIRFDALVPVLNNTPGAGPKALTVASLLVFAGAAGRAGFFPLQGWVTGVAETPPGAQAAAQGLWTVMVIGLLYKMLPVLVSAGTLPVRAMAITCAISAVGVPLLGLAGRDARRVAACAGIGLTALALLALFRPASVALALTAACAVALVRSGLVLATAGLVTGMRTADLTEMGDGWNRMRSSALGLLLSVVALAGLAAGVGGGSLRPQWIAVYGAAIGLSALAAFRLYFSAAHGVLPRRRGFDPNRVRQVPGSMSAPVLFCFVLAAALAGAEFSARWLNFIDGRPHSIEPFAALAWLGAAAVGVLLAAVLYWRAPELGTRLTGVATTLWAGVLGLGALLGGRFLAAPSIRLAEEMEDTGLLRGESAVGDAIERAAGLARMPARVLIPLLAGLAVVVAALLAVFAPGVHS